MKNACTLFPEPSASFIRCSSRPADFTFDDVRWEERRSRYDNACLADDCASPCTRISSTARGAVNQDMRMQQSSRGPAIQSDAQMGNITPMSSLAAQFRDSVVLGSERADEILDTDEVQMDGAG